MQDQVAPVAGRGDVEEGQLVGALLVVAGGDLDRIAGVAQLDEVDALDDAAGGDVEAGDDSFGEQCRPRGVQGRAFRRGELVGARLRSGEVELAAVDRPAADDALDADFLDRAELLDVGQRRQPARGEHRDRQHLGQLDGGVDVDAGQHAVAADVGVDDALDAVVLELLRQVGDLVAGELAPAVGRDLAVLGVEADDDVAAERAARVAHEARVLDRGGADDDVAEAVVEVALDRVEVADAAAELDRDLVADLGQDRLHRRLVDRLAGEGAVQVDQVQAARAGVDPAPRHRRGVVAEDRRLVHVALAKAHAVPVLQVDRRDQQHGRSKGER